MSLLTGDVDECGTDGIERSASALAPYAGCIVPTFSATPEQPKHRIVLLLSRDITADEWPPAWHKFEATLAEVGIGIDRGCKNINRLYFAPVARSPEAWLGARLLTGVPVPVDSMLEAAREEIEEQRSERERQARARSPIREGNRDKYIAAALAKAGDNVASASAGGRHDTLLREAYSLARLGLGADEIERNLLDAFVSAAGEARRSEGSNAIRDAVVARGRGRS